MQSTIEELERKREAAKVMAPAGSPKTKMNSGC